MTENTSDRVKIILVQDYGTNLISDVEYAHVWIWDTEPNRMAAKKIWDNPSKMSNGSLTTFVRPENLTPEEAVLNLLDTIDLHHGEYSQSPPWHSIEVVGAHLSQEIRESLIELGVVSFKESGTGFIGQRPC